MSKYKIPTSQFGKLELDEKPPTSRRGTDVTMPATTRSATQQRRHAMSSQASSSTGTRRHRSSTSPTSRRTTGQSIQQQRPPIGHGRNGDEDDDDEDDDADDGGNGDGDGGDEGNEDNEQSRIQPTDPRLRFAEVMSVMADTPWTPREFLYYLHHATVPAFTIQTRLVHHVGRTLIRELSSQPLMNGFLGGINRTNVLGLVVQNLTRRFINIRQQLLLHRQNHQEGRDVAATVVHLDDFQRHRLYDFVDTYQQAGLLTAALQDDLSRIVIDILDFVVWGHGNLYAHSEASRVPFANDTYGGNLYERWRDLGDRGYLFLTLRLLRDRIRYTNVRRTDATFIRVDGALSQKNDVVWHDFNNNL